MIVAIKALTRAFSAVARSANTHPRVVVAYERDPRAFLTGPDLPPPPHERDYAENTAATVDEEVRANVEKAFQRALDLLRERRGVLDRTAQRLLEKETLEEAELTQLVNHPEPRSPQAAAE